jgi:hypothetical protein
MRDTPERDLAVADELGRMADARIKELESEVATLRAEAVKGICVYCGYIEQYKSLEQKAGEEGNAMRVAHIRQCEARPELKLIAFSEQLIDEVARLREALELLQGFDFRLDESPHGKEIRVRALDALARRTK